MIFTKNDIYSPKLVVTLLQMFPNLFPCVYFKQIEFDLVSIIFSSDHTNTLKVLANIYNQPVGVTITTTRPALTFQVSTVSVSLDV